MLKCTLTMIEGKRYLRMDIYHNGEKVQEDLARVYRWNDNPYIRRLSERMPLTAAMIRGETVIYE